MTEKEFNLSEDRKELLEAFLYKISVGFDDWKMFVEMLESQDKEFIRLLKEGFENISLNNYGDVCEWIDTLVGEDLK